MSSSELSEESLVACLKRASEAGSTAANEKVKELSKKNVPKGKLLDACGGSTLTLYVDGRTKIGKLLSRLTMTGVRVNKAYGGGYSVRLPYKIKIIPPVTGQERSIYYAADSVAADVIKTSLGIEAYASGYDS